jgi:hypothetical protein
VYTSDRPEQQDLSLLSKVCDDRSRIFPCLQNCLPCEDSLLEDSLAGGLLKLWNVNRCNGVVGVFNIAGCDWSQEANDYIQTNAETVVVRMKEGALKVKDNWDLSQRIEGEEGEEGTKFAIFQSDGEASDGDDAIVRVVESVNEELEISVGTLGGKIFTIAPMLKSGETSSGSFVGVIGFVDMFNPGGGVISVNANGSKSGRIIDVVVENVKEKRFGFIVEQQQQQAELSVTIDGREVEISSIEKKQSGGSNKSVKLVTFTLPSEVGDANEVQVRIQV